MLTKKTESHIQTVPGKKYFKSQSSKNPKCMSNSSLKPNDFFK